MQRHVSLEMFRALLQILSSEYRQLHLKDTQIHSDGEVPNRRAAMTITKPHAYLYSDVQQGKLYGHYVDCERCLAKEIPLYL